MLAVGLATGSLLLVLLRLAVTFRENGRLFTLTRQEAVTGMLTGLGNRRRLVADLEAVFDRPPARSSLLMILDLDGFKGYNDSFGHPAGDALLTRLAEKLATVAGPHGGAYRLGGDEFCLLVRVSDGEAEGVIDGACGALVEHGEGFHVSSSFGAVLLPAEAADASHALSLADERLYAQKRSRRHAPDRTVDRVRRRARAPRAAAGALRAWRVALALEVGRRLALAPDELDELASVAQLHDLGKLAVPDEILSKPGPLDEREWEFIHRHTVVGERILRASPAFWKVATLVRSSHENWDGTGYPDGLAGEHIRSWRGSSGRATLCGDGHGASVPARAAHRGGARGGRALLRDTVRPARRTDPRRSRARATRGGPRRLRFGRSAPSGQGADLGATEAAGMRSTAPAASMPLRGAPVEAGIAAIVITRRMHDCRGGTAPSGPGSPPAMTVGIVVFGLVFLAGLALGTRTRRPLATASSSSAPSARCSSCRRTSRSSPSRRLR